MTLLSGSLASMAVAQLAGTKPTTSEPETEAIELESLSKLPNALQSDKWDQLCDIFPSLKQGDNPEIMDGEERLTLGELVIISRAWNCLRNMIRCGLEPTLAMVELSGEMGNFNIYESLLKAKGPMSARQTLHFEGEALEIALRYSGDANANAPLEKVTPLMTHHKAKDLELLLKYGAQVDAADVNGRTALFYQHDIDCLKILLKHGANINHLDNKGHSAMDYWKNEEARQEFLASQGGQSARTLDMIQVTSYDGYSIIMNDLDNYAYLIINEGKNAEGESQIVYYFAQRFPRPQVMQTQDWTIFLDWLKELPAETLIHRYVSCQDAFTIPDEWTELHHIDELIAKLQLIEGEERSYCVCGKLENGHEKNR